MNIVAIGGGGFTHGRDAAIEDYLLSTVSVSRPNIGFLGTASGDNETKISRFYDRFKDVAHPTHLSLFGVVSHIEEWVLAQDIIYVGGGNTKSMLATWQAWHLPALLQHALNGGVTLAGVSAGAVCWFDTALSDSAGQGLRALPCLGLLNGSCCPHFDDTASPRKTMFSELIASGELPQGIGIDDGVAVHYRNGELSKVVSTRAPATACIVEANGSTASARSLTVEPLDCTVQVAG